jgi:hypothetical protein
MLQELFEGWCWTDYTTEDKLTKSLKVHLVMFLSVLVLKWNIDVVALNDKGSEHWTCTWIRWKTEALYI